MSDVIREVACATEFRRNTSGHALTIDPTVPRTRRPGPMELLLLALGACTATDVVIILEKKRQKLESLEVIWLGRTCGGAARGLDEVGNALSFPRQPRRRGGKARHPTQRGQVLLCCGMLRKTATLSWRYEILPPAS